MFAFVSLFFFIPSFRGAVLIIPNPKKIWMVYPNITPQSLVEAASSDAANPPVPRPPRVEYLATLSRHSAPVNVVRFSPNGAPACPRYYASLSRIYHPCAQVN